MTSPTGLLDFFVLEGSEYVERLDALLAAARGGQPEAQGFSQAAYGESLVVPGGMETRAR